MNIEKITSDFGKMFFFGNMETKLRSHFMKAGFAGIPYKLFGTLFWLSVFPTLVIFLLVWNFIQNFNIPLIVDLLGVFFLWMVLHVLVIVLIFLISYFYVKFLIATRVSKMEKVFPSFLTTVSENLRGGMTFERALWSSITPELGILAHEMRLAAKKVATGQSAESALTDFIKKYDSLILKRSFDLIFEGLRGGGRVATIIDKVVESIEETNELKADMNATNISYVIFIALIVVVITPGLFTLGFQFFNRSRRSLRHTERLRTGRKQLRWRGRYCSSSITRRRAFSPPRKLLKTSP